jgi:hypothetical protein
MTHKETVDRCADFLLNVYEAMDGTHEENKAALTTTLGGDDFNASRVLQAWMALPPRMLLAFQQREQADEGLNEWLESVID